jgi:thioredoxin 1
MFVQPIVVNLTPNTFNNVVRKNEYAIVTFCVPSVGPCKSFLPEFKDASKELESHLPKIRFASMNIEIYSDFAESKNIINHPTIWWFHNGKFSQTYNGGRIKDSIVEWLVKQTKLNYVNIETMDDLLTFKLLHDVGIFGFFPTKMLPNGTEVNNVNLTHFNVAARNLDVPFGRLLNSDVIQDVFRNQNNSLGDTADRKSKVTTSMIMLYRRDFKKFNESYFIDSIEVLQEWVLNNYLPLVVEYSMDTAIQLYRTHVKFRLFVLCENDDKIEDAMRKAAPLHRGQVTFIMVRKNQDRLLTYLNSTSSDFPSAHLTTMRHYINHYWRFDRTDFHNPSAYSDFIQRAMAGELEPHLF